MPIQHDTSDTSDDEPEEIFVGLEEYEKFLTVFEDGEVSDYSFDPKYIDEVLKNEYFLNHLYKDEVIQPCILDPQGWFYEYVDGECIKTERNVFGKTA